MTFPRFLLGIYAVFFASTAYAGDVVFYVTENQQPVEEFSISIAGEQKDVNRSGIAVFDLPAGSYDAQYLEFGEDAGGTNFTLGANQSVEIVVEIVDGEVSSSVSVYTPGAEESPPVGLVAGRVFSDETGEDVGIAGASVRISGTDIPVVTDEDGGYAVQLARGVYNFEVETPEGVTRGVSNVRVISGITSQLNVNLGGPVAAAGDADVEEVITIGKYEPNNIADTERFAITVIDALGAEQIARFGDSDAAASLTRVSGVTTERGQFAIVRGLSGRYVASTLNGNISPSTDPTRRDAPLDLFPAGVLETISVQKGFTPQAPGDSTGGYIEIKTKGLPDERINKLSAGIGGNSQTVFQDVNTYEGGDTDFLGFDDGTRELPGSVDRAVGSGAVRPQVSALNFPGAVTAEELEALGESLPNIYNIEQETAPPDVALGYSNGNRFEKDGWGWGYYADINFSNTWSEQRNGVRNDFFVANNAIAPINQAEFERSTNDVDFSAYLVAGLEFDNGAELLSKTLVSRQTEDTVRDSFGFIDDRDVFNRNVILQYVERELLSQQFSGVHFPFQNDEYKLSWRSAFARTTRFEPDRRTYAFEGPTTDSLTFSQNLERRFGDLTEDAVDLGLDLEFPFALTDSITTTLKTGAAYTFRDRGSSLIRLGFISPGAVSGLDPNEQNLEVILSDENVGPGGFNLVNTSQASDFYEAEWKIGAYYLSSETEFGEAFLLLAGARLESSEQELRTTDIGGQFGAIETNTLEADDVLPALALTWTPAEKHQFRWGFSQTVSRPDFTELSNAIFNDPIFDYEVRGNPDLQISDINNFDFRYEYYINDKDSISAALFFKDIDNPIERILIQGSGSADQTRSFENSDSAEVLGLEVDFQTTLSDTDDSTWFLAGNVALIDSEVTLGAASAAQEGQASRRLQGQSDWLLNLILGWDDWKRNQQVTLLFNIAGDRIVEVGQGVLPDVLQEPFEQLNLTYKYDYSDNLTLKARVENILNSSLELTQGGGTFSEFDVGTTFRFGFDYKF